MGKKDYKKGMADAISAYEAFGEKQEAAIRHVGAEIEKTAGKVDKLGGKIGEIADYITDKEKSELYKLNTPVDIADLEDAEKRILLAVLYQLSADEDEVTEEQQNYVRAVQQYLKIYNPQTEIDLSAVENIEDISAQKAVLQSVLEFFCLGTHPEELTEEQEDFLGCFQVNRKTRREIDSFINAIVEAVGIKGLSEKYGFVAETTKSEFAAYKDNGPIPEAVADTCVTKRFDSFPTFPNGQKHLETKDYLLFWANTCPPGFHHDEDDEDENVDSPFLVMNKRTGEFLHISMDCESVSVKSYDFNFCVVKNTIYFVNSTCTGSYPHTKVSAQIFALDLDAQVCRTLPFKYKAIVGYSAYNDKFHLSGNESCLMFCALITSEDVDTEEHTMKVGTYVVDLTQDNRTFLLKSGLDFVYDAFLWNGKFLFWGKKGKTDSIFQYDPKSKQLDDIFGEFHSDKKFNDNFSRVLNPGFWPEQTLTVIEQMQYIDGKYFFLTSYNDDGGERILGYSGMCIQKPQKFWSSIFSTGSIVLLNDCALHFEDIVGDGEFGLERFDYATMDTKWLSENDEVADEYFLLGNYLYRHYYGGDWQKTNISNGWDNLQWEIFQMPD